MSLLALALAAAIQSGPTRLIDQVGARCVERGFILENRSPTSVECVGARVERERGVELRSLPFDGRGAETRFRFTVSDEAARTVRAEVFVRLGGGFAGPMRLTRIRAYGDQIELLLAAVGATRDR